MDNNLFAERIKSLRQELKLSQAGFARLISTNQSTLSAYETGDRLPPYETLVTIAQQCQVSIDWLCGLSEKSSLNAPPQTYTDLIKLIIGFNDIPNIIKNIGPNERPVFSTGLGFPTSYITYDISFDDKHIVDFFSEQKEIQEACKKTPSGDKLYALWLQDVFERYNIPFEDAHQDPFLDTEIPFN